MLEEKRRPQNGKNPTRRKYDQKESKVFQPMEFLNWKKASHRRLFPVDEVSKRGKPVLLEGRKEFWKKRKKSKAPGKEFRPTAVAATKSDLRKNNKSEKRGGKNGRGIERMVGTGLRYRTLYQAMIGEGPKKSARLPGCTAHPNKSTGGTERSEARNRRKVDKH